MIKIIKKVLESKLIRDNIILFIGSFFAGVLGFLYHFYMGRVLGPAQYGVLGTILSAFYMVNIAFSNTIQTSITRFTVELAAVGAHSKIRYLLFRSMKKLFLYSALMYIAFLFFVPFLSSFLDIEKNILYLSGLLIFFSLLVPVGRGILQGMQRFVALSFNSFGEGITKFGFGILFVFLGFSVMGAIGAILVAYLAVFFLFFFPFKNYIFNQKSEKFKTGKIYKYSLPLFFMLVSLTALFSFDVVLVKHFFEPVLAGYYSALSLLGKIIFFGSVSISQVMFPKVSELVDKGENHFGLFIKSLLIVLGALFVALVVYFTLPRLLVSILFGNQFLPIVPYVGWFGVFIALYSLVYFISFYYVSLKKNKFIYLLILFNLLQILLIWFYHSSLLVVITIMVSLMFLLFVILFVPLLFSKNSLQILRTFKRQSA